MSLIFQIVLITAERQEYAQRYKLRELSVKQDLEASKCSLVEEKLQSKDLTHNLTRQYKTLQLQTETRIQMLEATVQRLTDELSKYDQVQFYSKEYVQFPIFLLYYLTSSAGHFFLHDKHKSIYCIHENYQVDWFGILGNFDNFVHIVKPCNEINGFI